MQLNYKPSAPGFSLTEMVVALGLVGIIAAMTIPTIIQAHVNSEKKAILKEALMTLHDLQEEGMQTERLTETTFSDYFLERINASKTCPTVSKNPNQGCWDEDKQGVAGDSDMDEGAEPGVVLPNGAQIVGLGDPPTPFNGVFIDWNGPAGNNTVGDDQLWVSLCFDATPCSGGQKPGTVAPNTEDFDDPAIEAKNTELFDAVFNES